MLTTCPECHTSFRVGQAQLDSRRGLVRCGRCSAVFNAYDTLLPELATPDQEVGQPAAPSTPELTPEIVAQPPAQAPLDVAAPAAEPDRQAAEQATPQAEALASHEEALGFEEALAQEAIAHSEAELEAELEQAYQDVLAKAPGEAAEEETPAEAPAETQEVQPAPETSDSILLSELPAREPSQAAAWQSWLWGVFSMLLLVLFGAQLVYFLRQEIAGWWPETRPLLVEACSHVGCTLQLPRDLRAVRIEASSLETDPEDASRASLRVTISNRSSQPVAWPHLVLILTDVRDAPIAQRPFKPSEYLPLDSKPEEGMPPGQEQEVRLDLELKGLSAYGYKLDKQYP